MILQALKEYYDRNPELPREGWERKEIPFLVLVNEKAEFVGLKDTRQLDGKRLWPKSFLVPSLGEKKGSGIKANLFWENIEYMFDIPVPPGARTPKEERVHKQHQEFKRRITEIGKRGRCETLDIVLRFLESDHQETVKGDKYWNEVVKLNQPLLLSIVGKGPVTDDEELRQLIDDSRPRRWKGRCLVTGSEDEIVALEPPIKGVPGTSTAEASLVSFNIPVFESFGKGKCYNSPIGRTASFAYSTALNHLLRRNSPQKLQVADATTIFWSQKPSSLENDALLFFAEPPRDDPNRNTQAVKALYASIWAGAYIVPDDHTRFYVLGLSPNAARIAVRFWHTGTVREMATRFKQHIDDLAITHSSNTDRALPIRRLLRSLAVQNKDDNIPPNLAGDTMRAILEGLPYPATLLQAAVRRNRAEQDVPYPRAAIIKACLNRTLRSNNLMNEKEITMCLDHENINIGYRLGRLFATLEKIQQEANPGINATIRDRFYGAASSTPVTVFGNLMRLSNHHLSKLEKEKPGLFVLRKQLIGDIMGPISDFPPHLDMPDQGRFAIGYYHQTQDLWAKRAINS